MPGLENTSWGYHGDDGHKFNNPLGTGLRYSDPYNAGDIIGCGIDMRTRKLFFTKNGVNLGKDYLKLPHVLDFKNQSRLTIASPQGVAFRNVEGMLFPVIFSRECDGEITVNFGKNLFFYDITTHDWTAEDSALARSHEIHTVMG